MNKVTLWNRILFLLSAVLVGIPLFSLPAMLFLSFDFSAIVMFCMVSTIIGIGVSCVPVVHRVERFLTARLFGTELGSSSGPKAYWSAVAFSCLHLVAGLAVHVCCAAVPLVLSELARSAEEIFAHGMPFGEIVSLYVGAAFQSKLYIFVAGLLFVALVGAVAHFVCAPILARSLLGPDLGEQLAESEAGRHRLEVQNEMARDIHDSLGHTLTIATLQAESGRAQLSSAPEATRDALSVILSVCQSAQADLDDVLRVLHTGQPGLDTAVRDLSSIGDLIDNARAAGLRVDVDIPLNLELPTELSRPLYRIVQECLTNALRHAEPQELTLQMRNLGEGGIRLATSNPVSPDTALEEGRGLGGIRARAELIGGHLWAVAEDGCFMLEADLPAHPVPGGQPSQAADGRSPAPREVTA